MKKGMILIISVVLCMVLSSCSMGDKISKVTEYKNSGIENFHKHNSKSTLTSKILPTDDFLQEYSYTDADYQHYDNGISTWGYEKILIFTQYNEQEYSSAKECCFEKFKLNEENKYESFGFSFIENITLYEKSKDSSRFPESFNMFGYNDDSRTLIFMGYYNGDPEDKEKDLLDSDFDQFLQDVFSEYYDWI